MKLKFGQYFATDAWLRLFGYLAKYAYLGALNMVKWGIPEKILQNAVQTRLVLGQ